MKETLLLTKHMRENPENSHLIDVYEKNNGYSAARKVFKENNWPTIDVTRKSVEETAASIIKIYEIKNKKNDWHHFGFKKQGKKRNS